MRRKIVSIVMASAMVLGLAACGSSGGTTTSSSNGGNDASAADDTTAKSESSDVVEGGSDDDNTLTVWTWDPNFNVYAIQKAAEIYAQDHEGFKVAVVSTLYYKSTKLERAIDRLFVEVDKAYRDGANILVLSDRGVDEKRKKALPLQSFWNPENQERFIILQHFLAMVLVRSIHILHLRQSVN